MPMPAHQETTDTVDHLSRRMWRALEPYHALVYFIPETRQRTAPLGPVPAEVVTALFYHFHPSMVRRAIPDAWSYASPDALTEARVAAAGEGQRRRWPARRDAPGQPQMEPGRVGGDGRAPVLARLAGRAGRADRGRPGRPRRGRVAHRRADEANLGRARRRAVLAAGVAAAADP